jgi:PAS domain-containing protein
MISSALNRRYAQTALQESEEVFPDTHRNCLRGLYIYRDAKFIYVNPMAEQLTGYSRKETGWVMESLLDLIHARISADEVRSRLQETSTLVGQRPGPFRR